MLAFSLIIFHDIRSDHIPNNSFGTTDLSKIKHQNLASQLNELWCFTILTIDIWVKYRTYAYTKEFFYSVYFVATF